MAVVASLASGKLKSRAIGNTDDGGRCQKESCLPEHCAFTSLFLLLRNRMKNNVKTQFSTIVLVGQEKNKGCVNFDPLVYWRGVGKFRLKSVIFREVKELLLCNRFWVLT